MTGQVVILPQSLQLLTLRVSSRNSALKSRRRSVCLNRVTSALMLCCKKPTCSSIVGGRGACQVTLSNAMAWLHSAPSSRTSRRPSSRWAPCGAKLLLWREGKCFLETWADACAVRCSKSWTHRKFPASDSGACSSSGTLGARHRGKTTPSACRPCRLARAACEPILAAGRLLSQTALCVSLLLLAAAFFPTAVHRPMRAALPACGRTGLRPVRAQQQ